MARRSLDHGEAAAMQVALSLLDAMEHDDVDLLFGQDSPVDADESNESSKQDDDEDADSDAKARPLPKATRKRQRNRRKDEITYLKDKVAELELTLEQTKLRIADSKGVDLAELELLSIWEELAMRQQRKRQATEVENAKLRSMLKSQVQVARGLMRFLQQQPKEEDIPGINALRPLRVTATDAVELPVEEHLRRMDLQYGEVHTVFADDQEWLRQRTYRNVQLQDGGADAAVIELRTSWVVPFDLDNVERVLKQRSERMSLETKSTRFETLPERDGLLVSNFYGSAKDTTGVISEINGRLVNKSYREPGKDQAFILSELVAEPLSPEKCTHAAYAVHSKGWIRVQPYKLEGALLQSSQTRQFTHIQWFRRVKVLPRLSTTVVQRRQVGAFTELVLAHISEELDEGQQLIEDMLMQDTVAVGPTNDAAQAEAVSAPLVASSLYKVE